MKLSVVSVSPVSAISLLRDQSVKVTDMTQETSIMKRLCVMNDFTVNLVIFLDVKHCGLE